MKIRRAFWAGLIERKLEPGYVFLVYSGYLVLLNLGLKNKNPLTFALLNPDWLHFFLIPAYLFYLDRHDSYYIRDYCFVRFSFAGKAWVSRLSLLLPETVLFTFPYLALHLTGTVVERKSITECLYGSLSWCLLVLFIGTIACLLNFLLRRQHWGSALVFVLLTLDYLQANNTLFVVIDGSLFYYPLISAFKTGVENAQAYAFEAAGGLIVMFILSKLFLRTGTKPRRLRHRISWSVLWGIPIGLIFSFVSGKLPENIETLWLYVYGGFRGEDADVVSCIMYLAPFLITLLLWGSRIPERLESAAVLLFSRSESREKWLLREMIELGLNYLAFFLMQMSGTVIYAVIGGVKIRSFQTAIQLLGMLLLTAGGVTLVLVLFLNVWCMGRDTRLGFFFGGVVGIAAFFIPFIPNEKVAGILKRFFLPCRGSLLLHKRTGLLSSFRSSLFYYEDDRMIFWGTGLFVLVGLAAAFVYGSRRLKTTDIL